jgi:hypothetical protein
MKRIARLATATASTVGALAIGLALAGPAAAAPSPSLHVVGPVHLGSAGDYVQIRYTCTAAQAGALVVVSQATGGTESSYKTYIGLTCSGHLVVQTFPLAPLDPSYPTLKPGRATATINTAIGQSYGTTQQPVRVVQGDSR